MGKRYHDTAPNEDGVGPLLHPQEALEEIRTLAEAGDVLKQIDLGDCYRDGMGVPQDDTEAARWYRLAIRHCK